MRDIPEILMIVFVAFVFIMFGARYSINNIQLDSAVMNINETLRTTVIANRDDSARLNEGTFKLDKESFEEDFKERLINNDQFIENEESLVFDYLETEQGSIKAVKVKIIGDKNNYQATSILNAASD